MKYTEDHAWLRAEGDLIVVGITEHAAGQLGDVVFVELPEVETEVTQGDEVCVIESVKTAVELAAPLDGEIVEVNETLVDTASLAGDDPLGDGWLFKIRPVDDSPLDDFMDEDEYKAMLD